MSDDIGNGGSTEKIPADLFGKGSEFVGGEAVVDVAFGATDLNRAVFVDHRAKVREP